MKRTGAYRWSPGTQRAARPNGTRRTRLRPELLELRRYVPLVFTAAQAALTSVVFSHGLPSDPRRTMLASALIELRTEPGGETAHVEPHFSRDSRDDVRRVVADAWHGRQVLNVSAKRFA